MAAGAFAYSVQLQDITGRWRSLSFADGQPATVTLQVVPANAIPALYFQLSDARSDHIYQLGDTIRLQIQPVLTDGPDLSFAVNSVQVSTPVKPFSMTNPAAAKDLLTAAAGSTRDTGFMVDFWNVPDAQRYLDLTVNFARPVQLRTLTLTGVNLNDQFSLKKCEAQAITTGSPRTNVIPLPVSSSLTSNNWTLRSSLPNSITVTSLRLRLYTAYKINITSLAIQGDPEINGKRVGVVAVSYVWQDGFGKSLSKAVPLNAFHSSAINSPAILSPGYYGLVLTTHIEGQDDARREFGFAGKTAPVGSQDGAVFPGHSRCSLLGVGY